MPQPHRTAIRRPLYTPEERLRRDRSVWTVVQGILAPLQLIAFLISVWLVVGFLRTGEGAEMATLSIVIKTGFLYAIMVTGAIWEKEIFGVWLFAPSFFWEDVVSMGVIALHTAYLYALLTQSLSIEQQMWLALSAYALYLMNAGQFFYKLHLARRSRCATGASEEARDTAWSPGT
jgi:3-vinyl bacteriochlorophyllide hydratase